MLKNSLLRSLLAIICLLATLSVGQANSSINWKKDFPALPDPYGFAGSFAGVVSDGDERWLVAMGGANFPSADPFTDNVAKAWYASGYKIQLESGSLKPIGEWEPCEVDLPKKLGYGASVSLPSRGTSLFIGGGSAENGEMVVSDSVYEVSHDGGLKFAEIASLPEGVMNTSAVLLGNHVFVFSGEGKAGAVSAAWAMDISGDDSAAWKWLKLPWPERAEGIAARARGYNVTGARDGKVYVFGGRAKSDGSVDSESDHAVENKFYGTDDFKDCYVYTPAGNGGNEGNWTRIADLPKAISAAPSNALSVGSSHLLLFGGVSLDLLENVSEKRADFALNDALQGFEHPGFSKDVWMYHTITDTWAKGGEIESGQKPPVTAAVVIEGDEFVIVSGEWSPKLRTRDSVHGKVVGKKASFGVINWIVVAVYLSGMVGIGYWFMKREASDTTDDYFRGGQRIPWWIAGLSIFATLLSSITFMAIPALSYASDWNKWIGQWPIILIVPLVVFAYLPFFRKLNVTSAYEYLEARFSLSIRLLASIVFMIFHIGRIAIVLYLPALALSSVTNIDITLAIVVIGILCVIYTVIGGIEAVVWTDAIQALVLLGGALGCFFLVATSMDDGFGAIGSALSTEEKFISLDWGTFDISNATQSGWVVFLGFFFAMLPSYTSSQDVVQRYMTTSSPKEASRSLWMNIAMSLVGSAIFFALGTALYVFYQANPQKLDPSLMSTDGILPFFIMQNLPTGVAGLIIAGVFAAAQSTISSSLNSVAAAFVTDLYGRVIAKDSTDKRQLQVARNVVIILGILGVGVAILIAWSDLKSAFDAFNSFVGLVLGPLAAVFALGIFTKHVNAISCLIGALAGIASSLLVNSMNESGVIDVLPLLNGMICFVVTFVVAFILGFLFKSKAPAGLTIYDFHSNNEK